MKSMTLKAVALFCLLAACAFAENRTIMTVKIPFDFRVGATLLPAGQYTITENPATGLMHVIGEQRDARAVMFGRTCWWQQKGTSRVMFNRYGVHHFLAGLHSDALLGREIQRSAAEVRVAKGADEIASARVY